MRQHQVVRDIKKVQVQHQMKGRRMSHMLLLKNNTGQVVQVGTQKSFDPVFPSVIQFGWFFLGGWFKIWRFLWSNRVCGWSDFSSQRGGDPENSRETAVFNITTVLLSCTMTQRCQQNSFVEVSLVLTGEIPQSSGPYFCALLKPQGLDTPDLSWPLPTGHRRISEVCPAAWRWSSERTRSADGGGAASANGSPVFGFGGSAGSPPAWRRI